MNKHTFSMNKLYLLFSLCISIALLGGCASIDLPKGTSKGYSTYSIYKHSPNSVPDFSSKEDRTHELIKTALRHEFSKHGLKESGSVEDAELVISYLLVVQDGATSTAIRDYYVNSGSEILSKAHRRSFKKTKEYYTDKYVTGSLIFDIVDKKNNKLIYRDYVTRKMFDSLNAKEREQTIVEGVAEVTAEFFRK